MDQFKVEWQYQQWLKRMNLSEAMMHPQQKAQLKYAFYGAWGQLLILMRDGVTEFPSEVDGAMVLQDMLDQVGAFWDGVLKDGMKKIIRHYDQ